MHWTKKIEIKKIAGKAWASELSEAAHTAVFGTLKPKEKERVDYAWLALYNNRPICYVTVIELDSETAYWQYGGAFPWALRSAKIAGIVDILLRRQAEISRRVGIRVKNDNFPMLKLALSRGLKPIGIRSFGNETFLEMMREF